MAVPTSQSAFNAANNRLTAAGYDAAGNMTSHPWITPGGSMAYNANNLMTSFTATGVSVQTTYDAEGRRVRKIKGTEVTLWVYDAAGRLAAEYRNGSGPGFAATTPEREYSYGVGRLVAVHEGTNRYYRTTDHLGSTRVVTDQTGAVKQRRDFFPFGEEIPADSSHGGRNAVLDGGVATYNASVGVRQQFTGQERDSETGLDYFLARNLSAPLGRFLSVDPLGAGVCAHCPQTWNAYGYVKNQPFKYIDPDGRSPMPVVGFESAAPPPPSPPSPPLRYPSPVGLDPNDPKDCQLYGKDIPGCPNYEGGPRTPEECVDQLGSTPGFFSSSQQNLVNQTNWGALGFEKQVNFLNLTGAMESLGLDYSGLSFDAIDGRQIQLGGDLDAFISSLNSAIQSGKFSLDTQFFSAKHHPGFEGGRGYRQNVGSWSMQIGINADESQIFIDIDRYNPANGVPYAVGHLIADVIKGGPSATQVGSALGPSVIRTNCLRVSP